MKRIFTRDAIIGFATIIFAVAVYFMSNKFAVKNQGIGLNPALYPQAIAIIVFIMGTVLLITTLIKELKRKEKDESIKNTGSKIHIKSVFLGLGIIGYIIAIYLFGFTAPTLLFTTIATTAMGTKWRHAVLICVPLTAALYAVFFIVFAVPPIHGVLIGLK